MKKNLGLKHDDQVTLLACFKISMYSKNTRLFERHGLHAVADDIVKHLTMICRHLGAQWSEDALL